MPGADIKEITEELVIINFSFFLLKQALIILRTSGKSENSVRRCWLYGCPLAHFIEGSKTNKQT
jgi:hypothetical protein